MLSLRHLKTKALARLKASARARVEPWMAVMVAHRPLRWLRKWFWTLLEMSPYAVEFLLILGAAAGLIWGQWWTRRWMTQNDWAPLGVEALAMTGAVAALIIFIGVAGVVHQSVARLMRWVDARFDTPWLDALMEDAERGRLPAGHPFSPVFDRFRNHWLAPMEWRALASAPYTPSSQHQHLDAVLTHVDEAAAPRARL